MPPLSVGLLGQLPGCVPLAAASGVLRQPAAAAAAAGNFAGLCFRHGRRSTRQVSTNASTLTEQARYIEEVAVLPQPKGLDKLIQVLEAQQHSVVAPTERNGLHPLLIPLTRGPASLTGQLVGDSASAASGEVYVCLLRWHNPREHKAMELPVVAMSPGANTMSLLARSVDEYVTRALVEEDFAGGPGTLAAAAAAAGGEPLPYRAGEAAASGLPSLAAFITRKVGLFPDTAEALVANHLAKGDTMSAMITGEWYMRNFAGWARPLEFNSMMYRDAGRHEEARDTARLALRNPWWSLSLGFEEVRDMAGLKGDAARISYLLSDEAAAAQRAQTGGFQSGKDEQEIALEAADVLMNMCAAGERAWDDIRPELADRYQDAGFPSVADFIRAA